MVTRPIPQLCHTCDILWSRGDTPHIGCMSLQPDTPKGAERRSNARLRELVDEMMATIRAAANIDLWTPDERSRYEADMARIMSTVRDQALDRRARLD